MAKGKIDKNANIQGYFFMSINNGDLDVNMGGDKEMLSAAFATLLVDRDKEGNDLGTITKSVKMSVFVPILIKAMQEMNQQNQDLKSRLDKAGL